MEYNQSTIQPLGSSFRDPSGFLFHKNNVLYRQVNQIYQENYIYLMESGLYQNLVDSGLLISHKEAKKDFHVGKGVYKVLQPEPVFFISYPYEWCFSQLKDAALSTLKIQKKALEFNDVNQ